jgi:hypothetical protein
MKIIFLDIDGVLNSMEFIQHQEKTIDDNLGYIDEQAIKRLAKIVQATQAQIVLSSSWRSMFDDDMQPQFDAAKDLVTAFKKYQLKLMSKTSHLNSKRGAEVRDWLAQHPAVQQFVILDDAPFPDWNNLTPHWIQTDWRTGLTEVDVKQAIMMLNKK